MSLFTAQELFNDLQEEQATDARNDYQYDEESPSFDEISSDSSFNDLSQLESHTNRQRSSSMLGRSTLSLFSGHSNDIQNPIVNIGACLPLFHGSPVSTKFPFKLNSGNGKKKKRKHFRWLDTLPMEEDEPTYWEIELFKEGGTHIDDLPDDPLRLILSFLPFSDLKSSAQVCSRWYQIHKHNIIWERWLRLENNGSLKYSVVSLNEVKGDNKFILKAYYRKYKKMKKKKGYSGLKRKLQLSTSYAKLQEIQADIPLKNANTVYFRTYRRMLRDRKRIKKLKKKMIKQEKLRKHYEYLFRKPQKIAEAFFLTFYNPLFFLGSLFSTITLSLYLDKIVPNTEWYLLMIMTPIVIIDTGYFFAMFSAIVAELLSSFRRNRNFNGLVSMIYLGNVWLPVSHFLVVLKLYILPQATPWRVAFAPLWVLCCIYSITSIILRNQIPFLQWETDQKVMWWGTSFLNTVITFTTAFLATTLDDPKISEIIRNVYSTFVFTPIWIFLIVSIIAIPIFGYAFLNEFGFILTVLLYTPASALFVLPFIPFFIMLALKMDGLISFPYIVIFSPIVFWEMLGLLASFLVIMVAIKKGGLIP